MFNRQSTFFFFFFFKFWYGPVSENPSTPLKGSLKSRTAIAKFESDLLKRNDDEDRQGRKLLKMKTFVWWGTPTCPPPYKRLQKLATLWSYTFARDWRTNLVILLMFKALFSAMSTDFYQMILTKKRDEKNQDYLKNHWFIFFPE